jgi:hypothetical protein
MSIGAPTYRDANIETLSGGKTLTINDARYQTYDPGGSGRTIVLPAEAAGLEVIVSNGADASEDLTVNNDAGATIVTISQNEDCFLYCDGTNWNPVLSKGAT